MNMDTPLTCRTSRMKNWRNLFFIAASLVLSDPVLAQESAPAPAAEAPGRPNRADVIKQFDQNGDGVLDETERQAAREALNARSPRRTAGQTNDSSPSASELMRRFDKNGGRQDRRRGTRGRPRRGEPEPAGRSRDRPSQIETRR